MVKENNILIIGGPNVGKTHFGGQLYGRLMNKKGLYKILSPPENLNVFKEVINNLAEGKSAGRTHVSSNEQLSLEIEDLDHNKTIFSFPDYGGEQIDKIVNERRINNTWKDKIDDSTAWMLFVRLDAIKPLEDVVNRGIPEQKIMKLRNEGKEPLAMSASAFFIELLQILSHVKKISTFEKNSNPKLIVALSCWDNIDGIGEGTIPSKLFEERLPLVKQYIDSVWNEEAISVIGLSSTERTLSDKNPDDEFIDKGPENFGYIVDTDGKKENDLTKSIAEVIG